MPTSPSGTVHGSCLIFEIVRYVAAWKYVHERHINLGISAKIFNLNAYELSIYAHKHVCDCELHVEVFVSITPQASLPNIVEP